MSNKLILSLIIIAIAAVGLGSYAYLNVYVPRNNSLQTLKAAAVLQTPQQVAAFSLIDNKNQIYTNQNLLGHWTFMFFGFTHCASICPVVMSALRNTMQILETDKIQKPQVVFVTLDPDTDTPAQINKYVTAFDPNFIGLTGPEKAVNALADNLKILHLKFAVNNEPGKYEIDHSGSILVINPEGKLAAIFAMPHKPAELAYDFAVLQKHS